MITKERIQELADKGLHQAEIARQLDCSRENIRQWCNKHNTTVKHKYRSRKMFESEDQGVDIWIKVSCNAVNLEKANKLSFLYFENGDIRGLEDEEGNQYIPHLALEVNSGEDLLKSESEIEERLGLQIAEYVDYGVSEVY